MGKTKIARILNTAKMTASKHSPEILTGLGIAGMITTTVLAVRATPKAMRLIEHEEDCKERELSKVEVIKTAWKCYIPAAITGTVSVACLIGASSINARRNAALVTAYKLSETALSDYREKVIETIGEKKERGVHDKVAEKQIRENPVKNNEVVITGNGCETLCYDPMSGRYFNSTIEKIRAAENALNKSMLHDIYGYATLNDLYDQLDLPHTDIGDMVGWNTNRLVDLDISPQLTEDNKPCIALVYYTRPEYDFDKC